MEKQKKKRLRGGDKLEDRIAPNMIGAGEVLDTDQGPPQEEKDEKKT